MSSVAGDSWIASIVVLAGMLVASTMHISTGLSLQVARVCKWVSRRLNLPQHLALCFCFLVVFLERVFCDIRWTWPLPCLKAVLEVVPAIYRM